MKKSDLYKICGNCKHFNVNQEARDNMTGNGEYECIRFPPIFFSIDCLGIFPRVSYLSSCGEWGKL